MAEKGGQPAQVNAAAPSPNAPVVPTPPAAMPKPLPSDTNTYMFGLGTESLVMWQGESGGRAWVVPRAEQAKAARLVVADVLALAVKAGARLESARHGRNVHLPVVLFRLNAKKPWRAQVQVRGPDAKTHHVTIRTTNEVEQVTLARAWAAQGSLANVEALRGAWAEVMAAKAAAAAPPAVEAPEKA